MGNDVSAPNVGPDDGAGSPAAAPDGVPGAGADAGNGRSALAEVFRRYFTPLSASSLVGVIVIFLACVALWDVAWLRPYLAAGGAGLAAFLGPIPGIISPEARSKWLASIVVAAVITVGTWLATRDLEDRLDTAVDSGAAHDAFVAGVLGDLSPAGRQELFRTAPHRLWLLYNEKDEAKRDYKTMLDMAVALLAIERENGHALYFAGQAQWQLGNRAEMIRLFQHYVALAREQPEAMNGDAKACYARAHGYCAERWGWVSHLLADAYLTQALGQADADRGETLSLVLDYEMKAVTLKKWKDDHHHAGFNADRKTGSRSSCSILHTVAREQMRLGIDAAKTVQLGMENLGMSCPQWPATPAPAVSTAEGSAE